MQPEAESKAYDSVNIQKFSGTHKWCSIYLRNRRYSVLMAPCTSHRECKWMATRKI